MEKIKDTSSESIQENPKSPISQVHPLYPQIDPFDTDSIKDNHSLSTETHNNKNHLIVLLSNIQSFGKTDKTDKTAELELVLKLNKVQVGVFTETWLDDITCQHLDIDNYVMFHATRSKSLRASGGVSIFVSDDIPSTKLNVCVPNHLEVIYVSIRPKWLPRSISNIVLCGVYYPMNSKYAPPKKTSFCT